MSTNNAATLPSTRDEISNELIRLEEHIMYNILYAELDSNNYLTGLAARRGLSNAINSVDEDLISLITRWTKTRGLWVNEEAQRTSFNLLFEQLQPIWVAKRSKKDQGEWADIATALVQAHILTHSQTYGHLIPADAIADKSSVERLVEGEGWTVVGARELWSYFARVIEEHEPELKGEIILGTHKIPEFLLTNLRVDDQFVQPGLCEHQWFRELLGIEDPLPKHELDLFAYYCKKESTYMKVMEYQLDDKKLSEEEKLVVLKDMFIY